MTTTAFRIRALSDDDLRSYWGSRLEVTVHDEDGGAPLRCCLTEAARGTRVALVAHRPFSSDGPYAETGPVYIHADRCTGYTDHDVYPPAFRHRQQVLRAYDHDGRIHDARLVEGRDAETAITSLLADPDVAFLHSRNVLYGCYMFAIDRA